MLTNSVYGRCGLNGGKNIFFPPSARLWATSRRGFSQRNLTVHHLVSSLSLSLSLFFLNTVAGTRIQLQGLVRWSEESKMEPHDEMTISMSAHQSGQRVARLRARASESFHRWCSSVDHQKRGSFAKKKKKETSTHGVWWRNNVILLEIDIFVRFFFDDSTCWNRSFYMMW